MLRSLFYFNSDETLLAWTQCQLNKVPAADILDWSNVAAPSSPIVESQLTLEDFCPLEYSSVVVLPGVRNFDNSVAMCTRFRKLFIVMS